jgi:hypothetical protein
VEQGIVSLFRKSLLIITLVRKIDPHIGVLAGFLGFIWIIIGGENRFGCRAIGRHWARCKSALFWQTERQLSVFSTGTEKEGFAGFSVCQITIRKQVGARIGLIFP